MGSIYDFHAHDIDGRERSLAEWRGQVLLVVNVASKCGFTPQYEGLERLQRDFGAQGFSVLGFPCDQFGHQEPGDAASIKHFCTLNYAVSFPMFAKLAVNGHRADPLYRWLKGQARGWLGSSAVKWNFTKFLIDREGQVLRRYAPTVKPAQLRADIEALLP